MVIRRASADDLGTDDVDRPDLLLGPFVDRVDGAELAGMVSFEDLTRTLVYPCLW